MGELLMPRFPSLDSQAELVGAVHDKDNSLSILVVLLP